MFVFMGITKPQLLDYNLVVEALAYFLAFIRGTFFNSLRYVWSFNMGSVVGAEGRERVQAIF